MGFKESAHNYGFGFGLSLVLLALGGGGIVVGIAILFGQQDIPRLVGIPVLAFGVFFSNLFVNLLATEVTQPDLSTPYLFTDPGSLTL